MQVGFKLKYVLFIIISLINNKETVLKQLPCYIGIRTFIILRCNKSNNIKK